MMMMVVVVVVVMMMMMMMMMMVMVTVMVMMMMMKQTVALRKNSRNFDEGIFITVYCLSRPALGIVSWDLPEGLMILGLVRT
jgi:maltodextrin utilization protein YvdJ